MDDWIYKFKKLSSSETARKFAREKKNFASQIIQNFGNFISDGWKALWWNPNSQRINFKVENIALTGAVHSVIYSLSLCVYGKEN